MREKMLKLLLALVSCGISIGLWGAGLSANGNGANATVDGDKPNVSSSSEKVYFTDWGSDTYSLTAQPGDGYVFIDEDTTITAGEPDGASGESEEDARKKAKAKKTIDDPKGVPENFSLGLSGRMYKPGDGEGNAISWSAQIETKFFHISSSQGTTDAIIVVGDSISYTAYEGNSSVASNWKITRSNGGGLVDKSGITSFNFSDDVNVTSWKVPGTTSLDGNTFSIEATHPETDATATGTLKIVAPDVISLSKGVIDKNANYGKAAADVKDNIHIHGDLDRKTPIQLTVTTKPNISYDEIPSNWTGVSTETVAGATLAGLYTSDSSQPKLKGKIIPDVLGCVGYLYAGGNDEKLRKFIKFIKFGISVIPTPDTVNLYVLKTNPELSYVDFDATVHPAMMADTIAPTDKFKWEILSGEDKVKLEPSGPKDNHCRITALGLNHLSSTVNDVVVKVSWVYATNKNMRGEKEIKITVRSIWSLTHTSTSRLDTYSWQVKYRLNDQLGEALPDNVCSGLKATESWERNLWPGPAELGEPTLSQNSLIDTFVAPISQRPSPVPGNGRQTITIDHMKRTHDVGIPTDNTHDAIVNFSNVIYRHNQ